MEMFFATLRDCNLFNENINYIFVQREDLREKNVRDFNMFITMFERVSLCEKANYL